MAADSNSYKLRWQRDAHRALGEFLATAAEMDLPALSWTIAISGALVGDVDSLTSTPDEQRAAFRTWAGWLGADVVPERVDSDEVTHLYAKFTWSKKASVGGAIRADIAPPMDDGDGDV
ncbi:hypothetical protein [Streptomyces mirabilis]|uniref:hypothetical protein n=1 Tax=Streptomyces mirabilis TaxID=68239 RepID=UPI0036687AD6